MLVKFRLNGEEVEVEARPNEILLDTLRLKLNVRSVKRGCEKGECGACTILLNGDPVTSCLILTPQVERSEMLTVEGLQEDQAFKKLVGSLVSEAA
ncbi:MAG: 2Fe-2S iron-sulfur cluster-binding protein, partial [Zestosphaera sp.]